MMGLRLQGAAGYAISEQMRRHPCTVFHVKWLFRIAATLLPLLAAAGCTDPATFGNPHLVPFDDGSMLLTLQVIAYGQSDTSSLFVVSGDANRADWEEQPRRDGKVAGAVRMDGATLVVFADGTCIRRADDADTFSRHHIGRGSEPLLHARVVNGRLVGVRRGATGGLQVWHFGAEGWKAAGPELTLIGKPLLVRITSWQDDVVLLWRRAVGGRREPGLEGARLNDGQWQPFPCPPDDPTNSFFAVEEVGERLFLLQEPDVEPTERREALLLSVFDGQRWERQSAGIALPVPLQRLSGLGLALTVDGDRLLAVRTDGGGVHVFRAGNLEGVGWHMAGTALEQRKGDLWGSLALVLLLITGFLLLVLGRAAVLRLPRRSMAGGADKTVPGASESDPSHPQTALPEFAKTAEMAFAARRVGGIASAMDRGLAMVVDMMLVAPLPLFFWDASSDYEPAGMPAGEWRMLYYIWLGGFAVYAAVAEGVWGQTIGKRLLRIRVRSVLGGPVHAGQAIVRNLLRFVDFWLFSFGGTPLPYLVALVAVLLTARRQRVGDLLGGTVVRMHTPLAKRAIILASASPRRRELLSHTGLEFRVAAPDVNERMEDHLTPEENAMRIARRKADAVARRLSGQEIVIAADTIVVLDNQILGKPENLEDAKSMLRRLSGSTHAVLTGLAVIDRATGQMLVQYERTDVRFRTLSEWEIEAYVDSGEADGKAGAYAIQETAGHFVADLRGSFTNVVGLPMELLHHMLSQLDG